MQTISLNKKISKFHILVGVLILIATLMSIWCASTAINNAMVTTNVKPSNVIYTQTEVNSYLS